MRPVSRSILSDDEATHSETFLLTLFLRLDGLFDCTKDRRISLRCPNLLDHIKEKKKSMHERDECVVFVAHRLVSQDLIRDVLALGDEPVDILDLDLPLG